VPEVGTDRRDDPTIPDAEDLYRRVDEERIVTEQATGRKRLSSQAFSDRYNEISVDLSSMISPEESLRLGSRFGGGPFRGIVAISAGQARDLDQAVVRDLIPEDPARSLPANPAHSLICGKKSAQRRLAKRARWVYPPDQNPLV